MKGPDDLLKTAPVDWAIRARLLEIRRALNLTKVEVAEALSITGRSVGKFEEGARIPASRLWQFCARSGPVRDHDGRRTTECGPANGDSGCPSGHRAENQKKMTL